MGAQSTLNQTHQLWTPALFKLTSGNKRLQFRLANDGYNRQQDGAGGHIDGIGDTYAALQYLAAKQSARAWDMSVRGTVKLPGASGRRGVGTGKADYGFLRLAGKDMAPALHLDANPGYSSLGRPIVGGFDNQAFAALSATILIPKSKWGYTNEIVWFSAVPGVGDQVTTVHGLTYSVRPWDVWDAASQFGITRDAPRWQILAGRTFFAARPF